MTTKRNGEYQFLRSRVNRLSRKGPSDRQRADWAYGNAKIENSAVTREMADRAVRERSPHHG